MQPQGEQSPFSASVNVLFFRWELCKMYSYNEVMTFVEEEDVKFIRLAFCDVFGNQKNISIMPSELKRAFLEGIPFEADSVPGFETGAMSDLILHPDPATLAILPWRPSHGRVVRMFCDITYPDGTPFERDGRDILQNAVEVAEETGIDVTFSSKTEFYLFKTDEQGEPTKIPFDNAGYLDIAPADKGENVRREICFTLLDMGIYPESSHHEAGPGQNEIDFRHSDPMTAANDAVTFRSVVSTVATRNGLYASFSPKPLPSSCGNGFHITMNATAQSGEDVSEAFAAGILSHIREITLFCNPTEESYLRLGEMRAPEYINWSGENRSQLLRVKKTSSGTLITLRSPDPGANVYTVFSLLLFAGIEGVAKKYQLPPPVSETDSEHMQRLPATLGEALKIAESSEFVNSILPKGYSELFKR